MVNIVEDKFETKHYVLRWFMVASYIVELFNYLPYSNIHGSF